MRVFWSYFDISLDRCCIIIVIIHPTSFTSFPLVSCLRDLGADETACLLCVSQFLSVGLGAAAAAAGAGEVAGSESVGFGCSVTVNLMTTR